MGVKKDPVVKCPAQPVGRIRKEWRRRNVDRIVDMLKQYTACDQDRGRQENRFEYLSLGREEE